ncbi:hypothetical protein MASR2M48_01560 [Spirochaetota bacterium]
MSLELPGPKGYCTSQLIPYLGNKRSLLPRLMPVFARLIVGKKHPRFLDVFSGSGAVSRLARSMGMRVEANDWEPYAQALNECWLGLSPEDVDSAFDGSEGLHRFMLDWNSMHPQAAGRQPGAQASKTGWIQAEPYMARWYAPARTEAPRLGEERLFYTAENATFIDRVRERIDSEFPDPAQGSPESIRRRVVLATLLLEAAVHANTSGVFKAYHAGFGGHGKDALGRIMGRMELETPILPLEPGAGVYCGDARAFVSGRSGDIAYFDPPYNQHQYGSNYHILNTIVRWDRLPRPMDVKEEAGHSMKAGIPESWKKTRSPFCSKKTAEAAIEALVDACDAAHLVFSWNADAHVSGEDMARILATRGKLEIVALDYVSYRGGRQSIMRSGKSREYLFVVDTKAAPHDPLLAVERLKSIAAIDTALRSSYDPERVSAVFGSMATIQNPVLDFGIDVDIETDRGQVPGLVDFPEAARFFRKDMRRAGSKADEVLYTLDPVRRNSFIEALGGCVSDEVQGELSVIYRLTRSAINTGNKETAKRLCKDAPRLIRKLAHDKYSTEFKRWIETFRSIVSETEDNRLSKALLELESLLALRSTHS